MTIQNSDIIRDNDETILMNYDFENINEFRINDNQRTISNTCNNILIITCLLLYIFCSILLFVYFWAHHLYQIIQDTYY